MTKQFSVTAPDGLYVELSRIALRDRRSVSSTVVILLEQAVVPPPVALDEADGNLSAEATGLTAINPPSVSSSAALDERGDKAPRKGSGGGSAPATPRSSSAKGLAGAGGRVAADAARLPVDPHPGGRSPASVRKRARTSMCQHRRPPETFCPVCDS